MNGTRQHTHQDRSSSALHSSHGRFPRCECLSRQISHPAPRERLQYASIPLSAQDDCAPVVEHTSTLILVAPRHRKPVSLLHFQVRTPLQEAPALQISKASTLQQRDGGANVYSFLQPGQDLDLSSSLAEVLSHFQLFSLFDSVDCGRAPRHHCLHIDCMMTRLSPKPHLVLTARVLLPQRHQEASLRSLVRGS